MRPQAERGEEVDDGIEARRSAILAEEEERRLRDLDALEREAAGVDPDGPIDERPIDLDKELGTDWKSPEFKGFRRPKRR